MQEMAFGFDWFKNLWIHLLNPFELNLVPKKNKNKNVKYVRNFLTSG